MRALRLYPQGLVLEEVARPEPGPGDVLVRVHAAAITRDELTWPDDRLPATPSYELAGVVEASGDEVIALTPFDRDGVAADCASVPEIVLAPKPTGLSHAEASGTSRCSSSARSAACSSRKARRATCSSTRQAARRSRAAPIAPSASSRSPRKRRGPTTSWWS